MVQSEAYYKIMLYFPEKKNKKFKPFSQKQRKNRV